MPGFPTEERYKPALPGRRPLIVKLPSPAITDEPELKVCGFEVELTLAVTLIDVTWASTSLFEIPSVTTTPLRLNPWVAFTSMFDTSPSVTSKKAGSL